jgi:hypothetical protein
MTIKSILLLGAASLIGVAPVQAADVAGKPVEKAKPIEWVKACDGYGQGFITIPGTNSCLKLGGYLRYELDYNAGGTFTTNVSGPQARDNRATDSLVSRARAFTSLDTRTPTDFGVLRSYSRTAIQWTTNDPITAGSGAVAYIDRAFLQWAGLTAGRAQSFFDLFSFAPYSYQTNIIGSDSGGTGQNLVGYSAQLGNGVKANLSLEEQKMRARAVSNLSNPGNFVPGAIPLADNAGQQYPDLVASLRVDQAWGSAQIMGAVHQVAAQYYAGLNGAANAPCPANPGGVGANNLTTCGHPSDRLGGAVGAGALYNLPWSKGDSVGLQVNYAQGALAYVAQGAGANGGQSFQIYRGNTVALGFVADGVFANQTAIELIKGWSLTAGAEHVWMPVLRTAVSAGYMAVSYGSGAATLICKATPAQIGFGPVSNCSPNFSFWQIGTRTIYNPEPDLDLGVEILYNRVQTAFAGTAILPANGANPAGQYNVRDRDVVSAIFRVQRNFWP